MDVICSIEGNTRSAQMQEVAMAFTSPAEARAVMTRNHLASDDYSPTLLPALHHGWMGATFSVVGAVVRRFL